MDILTARYVTSDAFLAAYDGTLPHGGLLVPSTRQLAEGMAVLVEFVGRLLPEHMLVRATVVAARPAVPRAGVRAALLVAFPASERPTVDYVLGLVHGTIPARRRRQTVRLPVSVAARYALAEHRESWDAEVVDISVGGLALRVAEPLPVATRVVVALPLPGALVPLELAGEVVFVSEQQDRVGVKFDRGRGGGRGRLREAIRRLRAA